VFVDFFGKPACTNKGLALMAMKTKAPVVPIFIHRAGKDKHVVEVWDEIPAINTGDKEADIIANTQAYTRAIETYIRRHPDQWFWMHRRWKTQPPKDGNA
jgi:KDO2-lipid IV(A) lauroyltransferase